MANRKTVLKNLSNKFILKYRDDSILRNDSDVADKLGRSALFEEFTNLRQQLYQKSKYIEMYNKINDHDVSHIQALEQICLKEAISNEVLNTLGKVTNLANDAILPMLFQPVQSVNNSEKVRFVLGSSSNDSNALIQTHNCIFRSTNVNTCISVSDNFTQFRLGTTTTCSNAVLETLFLLPENNGAYQENIMKILPQLIQQRNEGIRVDMSRDLEFNSDGTCSLVAITKQEHSEKRRITFRMNVVTSQMFENAMRDSHISSLELTYTNIFPSDIRMFICLPVYRDGYINRKDSIINI